jgi:hypothetical protein
MNRFAALNRLLWAGLAAASLVAALGGNWGWALALVATVALSLLPVAFTAASGIVFPSGLLTGVTLFTAAALVLGEAAGLYGTTAWWDLLLHGVASAVLSLVGAALALLPTAGARPRCPVWVLATLAFSFSMMVGAMWEVLEFTLDQTFGTNTQRSGLPDTMWDIVLNLGGGTLGAVAAWGWMARGWRGPLSGLLGAFVEGNDVLYGLRRVRGRRMPLPDDAAPVAPARTPRPVPR